MAAVCLLAHLGSTSFAQAPAWWTRQAVINPQKTADDFAAANIGQLKNLAAKAAQEMNSVLPGGGWRQYQFAGNGMDQQYCTSR